MLYTKKGDGGETSLLEKGKGVSKASLQVEFLGELDELNSLLGVIRASGKTKRSRILEEIQQDLFLLQAECAGVPKGIDGGRVAFLEGKIGEAEKKIPARKSFVVSGSHLAQALFDFARAIARRAERRAASYRLSGGKFSDTSYAYLNRLSSLFYVLARQESAEAGINEESPRY